MDKERYENTRKEVGEQLTRVFKMVSPIVQKALNSMCEVMKNIMSDIDDIKNQIEFEKGFKRPWFMEMDTTKKHQVMNRKPMFSHIRNQI